MADYSRRVNPPGFPNAATIQPIRNTSPAQTPNTRPDPQPVVPPERTLGTYQQVGERPDTVTLQRAPGPTTPKA